MPMSEWSPPPCLSTHRDRRQPDHFVPSSTPFLARFGLEALATVRVEEDTGAVPRSATGSLAFGRNGLSSSNGRFWSQPPVRTFCQNFWTQGRRECRMRAAPADVPVLTFV